MVKRLNTLVFEISIYPWFESKCPSQNLISVSLGAFPEKLETVRFRHVCILGDQPASRSLVGSNPTLVEVLW
jgi:hypothetical protein